MLERPDIEAVQSLKVEWAPRRRSEHLGDMTRLDALVNLTAAGRTETVAIEIKYADQFDSRRVSLSTGPYRRILDEFGIWKPDRLEVLAETSNQLARCHALAASVAGPDRRASVLVLHHRDDVRAASAVGAYETHLSEPKSLRARSLDHFLEVLLNTANDTRELLAAEALWQRYGSEQLSETGWHRLIGQK